MSQRFENKVALITGAASGIGESTARRIISEGGKVVGADRDMTRLNRLASELGDGVFSAIDCDVTQRASTEASVAHAVETFGRLDVLVNSAGISRRNVAADADFEQAWDQVMEVNLKGSMLMSHAAVDAMSDNSPSGGSIVNIGSIMSFLVYHADLGLSDGFNPYPHSKGGVIQLTRDTAVHMASRGIRVNAVCPGFIDTQLTETLGDNPDLYKTIEKRHPLGRFGTPDEVANVITFLASDEASFVTGVAWRVDGGYVAC